MKELRELYEISKQENWIPDSHDNHIYAPCGRYMLRVAHVTRIADADLIAAMHNALPELRSQTKGGLSEWTNENGTIT